MINSIKHLTEVNGKKISHQMGGSDFDNNSNILVNHIDDTVKFDMLTKPASDGGDLNRCQWSNLDTLGLEQRT